MDLTIRECRPQSSVDDLTALLPAYLAIWNHPDNLPFLSFTRLAFTEPQVREWFSAHEAAGVRFFAAQRESGAIEALAITRENPVEGFELWGLGVAPERKGSGWGRRLVRHGIAFAEGAGYRAVTTQVFANNVPMLRLLLGERFLPVRMDHHRGAAGEDLVHLALYFG